MRLVGDVAVRIVASSAGQLSDALIEAPAQHDSLAGEPNTVRRPFQQGQSVEFIILGRPAVASSADLSLRESRECAGIESRHAGCCADMLQAGTVAPLASNAHLILRRCR